MAEQEGQATIGQALELGLSVKAVHRLVREGVWERTAAGVYSARPGVRSLRQQSWAGHLAVGGVSAVGGEAALRLAGLDRPVDQVEFWVPPDVQRRVGGFVVHRDHLGRLAHARGTLPVIRPVDALVDVGQHLPTEELIGLISDAVRSGRTSLDQLLGVLAERPRIHDRRRFRALVADMRGIESTLEYAYRRDVERAHDLPRAKRAVSVSVGTRSDALYDDYGVLVELDGRVGHLTGAFRDLHRDNRHTARGYTTLRYGSLDVRERSCQVAWQVGSVLEARGWSGPVTRCQRCRNAADSDFDA